MIDTKPPLDVAFLEHHGIKGMRWGVRKNRSAADKAESRRKLNRNLRIGATTVGVIGAAIAVAELRSYGNVPVKSFQPGIEKLVTSNKHGTSTYGHEAVKAFDQHVWKSSVSELSKSIAEGHASQDAWMKSIGLGSKNGVVDTAQFEKFLAKRG